MAGRSIRNVRTHIYQAVWQADVFQLVGIVDLTNNIRSCITISSSCAIIFYLADIVSFEGVLTPIIEFSNKVSRLHEKPAWIYYLITLRPFILSCVLGSSLLDDGSRMTYLPSRFWLTILKKN